MGEILQFNIGCRRCEHLIQIGKNDWMCESRVHFDDTEVIPIKGGKQTEDWNVCEGEDYKRVVETKFRKVKSS